MDSKPAIARALAIALTALLISGAHSALAGGHKAPNPKSGNYAGLVGPQTISFKVSPGGATVTNLSTTFNPATFCGVPAGASQVHFPTLKVHKGHFSGGVTVTEGTTTHYSIKGKFVTPTRATGTIAGSFTIRSLPPCNAKSPFSVKRKGR